MVSTRRRRTILGLQVIVAGVAALLGLMARFRGLDARVASSWTIVVVTFVGLVTLLSICTRLRWIEAAAGVAAAYLLLIVLAFVGTWLAAYAELGHAPQPNLDDPKGLVSPAVRVLYSSVFVLETSFSVIVAISLLVAVGLVCDLVFRKEARSRLPRVGVLGWYALGLWVTWLMLVGFVWMDPGWIVTWYFD